MPRRPVAVVASALLVATLTVVVPTLAGSTVASAAPGNPGTPSAPTAIYTEDFENNLGTSQVLLNNYTGAAPGNQRYTADAVWLTNCNGEIVEFNTPYTDLGNCQIQNDSAHLRQLAYALGAHAGDATPATNHAVTAYTENNPGANAVEFQTVSPITLPSATGRFLTFSVDAAAQNCPPVGVAPAYQFALLNGSTPTNVGGTINPCASGTAYNVPAVGPSPAGTVNAGTYTSNGSILFNGSSFGVRMTNGQGSGAGNDAAFDNIRVLDVTPQLDKAFSPASIPTNGVSTLTFTVTNTSELAAKNGWGFTDSLPAGLTLASSTFGGSCTATTTGTAGGSSIAVTNGSLAAGQTSCTITAQVTANSQGTYTNGPGNVTETGLNPPGDTTLTVTAPTVSCTTDPVIFNTGYNSATDGQLANGAPDQRWTVAGGITGLNYVNTTAPPTGPSPAALPPAGTTYAPAFAGKVSTAWANSQSGKSQWVSANYVDPSNGQNQATGYGDWYYRYQFNLDPAVDPATFQLTMKWLADNSVNGVWVNNVAQTGSNLPQSPNDPYLGGGFLQGSAASTTLAGDWKTGLNTILVQVKSYYTAEGFDAEVTSQALCPTLTVSKTITDRLSANDQFTVSAKDSSGATVTSVTTTGTDKTDTSAAANIRVGQTYTITDAMAAGSTNTIGDYAGTLVCTDTSTGATVTTSGSGPTWTFTPPSPDNYSCAVTNTPTKKSFTVTKTASTTGPVHPGDTVTYTVVVQNAGPVPYTAADPASFTDDLSAVLDDATYNNDATNGATYSAPSLSWSGALAARGSAGDSVTITYSVTVDNPDTGNGHLDNTVVTPPDGNCATGSTDPACSPPDIAVQSFRVVKTSTSSVVVPGATVDYTVTVTNTGQAAYTAADPASFTDDLSAVLDDATYNNDATGGATYTAPTLSWSNPLAVGATVTITYSVTVDNPDTGDKKLDNTVVTPPGGGGNCPTGSTDPACTVQLPSRSFTTVKTASATAASPGDTVTYTVVVTNTGAAAYTAGTPASFTDDLSGVLDDASYNNDVSATAGTVSYSAPTVSWSGALAVGASVTVTYSVKVDNPDTGDKLLRNAVTSPTGSGGGCVAGSTDPACSTTTPVRTYSVTKTASAAAAHPGSTVTYTVVVTNTGQAAYTAADPASFTDDLSAVLDDAAYNNDATNGATYSAPTLSWSGALAVGASVTVTYSVTVNDPDTGDHSLDNAVVTPPGHGGGCPAGSTDPACSTTKPVQTYSTTKTASTADAAAGDTVTYTVVVTNTGKAAYTAADPASFTDDLSSVLDDATYNNDATNGATYSAPTLSWSGALAVGASVTVTYSVTVNNPDTGDHHLDNTVVTPPGNGGGCPTGSTDPDCHTSVPVRSFSVTKTSSATSVTPGATVTYTVVVHNTGVADYTAGDPASFTDNLSKVIDDATYNNDADNGATYVAPVLSWSGALPVGGTVTITYSVTVNDPDTGDHSLDNTVVTPPGGGGGCPTGSTDPACGTVTPVQSFHVTKTADQTKVTPGSKVSYTVTVTNTGKVDYTAADPASFTDDLSNVLDDATYDNDASNGATYAAPTLSWSGALAVGKTETITYSVTVNSPDTGDKKLDNTVVTPPGRGGNCPTGSTDPSCTSLIPGSQLTVVKKASSSTATPGAKVTYTITVTNTGQTAYTTADPATFTDDLSKVLDDATYNKDASAGATVTGHTLSWSGPIAVGDTVTVTYSVTVNSPDTGDKLLDNTVTLPPGENSNCSTGSTDPACSTRTPVQAYTVKKIASASEVKPGDTVSYTITVTNTGQVAFTTAHPASFTDDLTQVLDDATYNNDADHGATYTAPKIHWAGALPVAGTVTVTYSVTVHDPDRGDGKLHNVVTTPPGPGGSNAANCPTGTSDPDCFADTGISSVAVTTPSGGGTAFTGNNTGLQLLLGGLLLAAGAVLSVAGLRRRRTR